MYLVANAGEEDVPWIARLTRDQSEQILFEKYKRQSAHIGDARNGAQLG